MKLDHTYGLAIESYSGAVLKKKHGQQRKGWSLEMFKFLRSLAVGLSCTAGIAAAQESAPPQPPDPAQLLRLVPKQGPATGAGQTVLGRGGATLNAVGNVPLGWNFFHATNCQWVTNGANNVLYVLPSEGGFWFYVNNVYAAHTFLTPCVNGNLAAIHVINGATGDFDSILTYPSK